MLLRIAPLAEGGVLLSGEFHPGVVAVARRMRGVFLRPSSSWRIDATTELLRSNLILELGLAEEQFEILDTVQELLSDGSFAPATEPAQHEHRRSTAGTGSAIPGGRVSL